MNIKEKLDLFMLFLIVIVIVMTLLNNGCVSNQSIRNCNDEVSKNNIETATPKKSYTGCSYQLSIPF